MFKANLKIAWRNLIKDKQFTFLNLIGLSIGLACTFLIYLWASDEMKMDKFHEKDCQLFQVMQNVQTPAGIQTFEGTPGPLAKALADEMPEIENSVAVRPGFNKGILSAGDKHIRAKEQYAGTDFFNIFSYHLIEGNKNAVLSNKNGIVISDELAAKLFTTKENIVGKTVKWDFSDFTGVYVVTGIFQKLPVYSSVEFDLLFNYDIFLEKRPQFRDWGNSNPNTYVVIKKETDMEQFNKKIAIFIQSKSQDSKSSLFLRPYSDKYLYGKYENGIQAGGRIEYVRLFSIIAIFILVIACINFMNLSTAKASRRSKEVGIKKVVGADKNTLVLQYLGESLLLSFLSVILAIGIVALFLPYFNQITGKEVHVTVNASLIISILSIGIITGLIAGSYPAFYLSSFRPASVLKGKLMSSLGELWIRKGLVIFQFSLSVIFMLSVLVIYKQMQLIQTKNLGYNKDNIIYFEKEGRVATNMETFLAEVKNIPGVESAANMGYDFASGYGFTSGVSWEGKDPGKKINFGNLSIGYDLIETLGYSMKEGRSFSKAYSSDSTAIIFNEAAILAMGLENPIGKTIELWGEKRTIVGVTQNFNFESLYENVKPCFLRLAPDADKIVVRMKAGNEEALTSLQGFYKTFTQGLPLVYKFLDEAYEAQYLAENRLAKLSRYFAGLAVIISCLGLFGLAAFTALKRQKEIGIRKIAGASVGNIVAMLSKDFLKLVVVAMILAFPAAWWMMTQWLNDFAYRTDIGVGIFITTGTSILLITLLTIISQAIKAGIVNPVKSLRE